MQDDDAASPGPETQAPEVDPERVRAFMEHLRQQQNLPAGILGGLLAALVGAVAWGFIAQTTEREIGWIAIGIGFLVGFTVQKLGRGVEIQFNVIGALFAFLGVVLGKVMAFVMIVAKMNDQSVVDVLGQVDLGVVADIFTETFSAIDLLFYGLALWAGWQYAGRRISAQEARGLMRED